LLYRGQVLDDTESDIPGAIRAWERFVQVAPSAEDQARVRKLIAAARSRN